MELESGFQLKFAAYSIQLDRMKHVVRYSTENQIQECYKNERTPSLILKDDLMLLKNVIDAPALFSFNSHSDAPSTAKHLHHFVLRFQKAYT